MMDLALREKQIIDKRRALFDDPCDVCGSCGCDMVKTKRIVSHGMSYRRRYCPLCNDPGAEFVEIRRIKR